MRSLIGFQLGTWRCIILIRVKDDTLVTRLLCYDSIEHNGGNDYSDCGANLVINGFVSEWISRKND